MRPCDKCNTNGGCTSPHQVLLLKASENRGQLLQLETGGNGHHCQCGIAWWSSQAG